MELLKWVNVAGAIPQMKSPLKDILSAGLRARAAGHAPIALGFQDALLQALRCLDVTPVAAALRRRTAPSHTTMLPGCALKTLSSMSL
jgi:hypothetical protein